MKSVQNVRKYNLDVSKKYATKDESQNHVTKRDLFFNRKCKQT